MEYKTQGTCSSQITFEVDAQNKLHNVAFLGGCGGNLRGICRLIEGKDLDEVIESLSGISCGSKGTSCPDQLATALRQYKQKQA